MRGLLLAATFGLGVTSAVAHADDTARCTVRSIEALNHEGGIDGRIADLTPQLSRPPFQSWHQFKLLRADDLSLAPGASASFELPEGRRGTLTYKQHLQPVGGKHRVRLQLEIARGADKQLSTVFVLDEGGTILHAGTRIDEGMLILGVSCKTGD